MFASINGSADTDPTSQTPGTLAFEFDEAYLILFENFRLGRSSFFNDGTPAEIFSSLGEVDSDFDGFGYSLAMGPVNADLSADFANGVQPPEIDVLASGEFGPVTVTVNGVDLLSSTQTAPSVNATAFLEMPIGPATVYAGVNAQLTDPDPSNSPNETHVDPGTFFTVGATLDLEFAASITVELSTDAFGDGVALDDTGALVPDTDLGVLLDFSFGAIDLSAEVIGILVPPILWEVTAFTGLSDIISLSVTLDDLGLIAVDFSFGAIDLSAEVDGILFDLPLWEVTASIDLTDSTSLSVTLDDLGLIEVAIEASFG
ncbi:MAG: hypothetical protein ACE5JP_05800 [Candidatus Bipolaricaulia bacterium]